MDVISMIYVVSIKDEKGSYCIFLFVMRCVATSSSVARLDATLLISSAIELTAKASHIFLIVVRHSCSLFGAIAST